MFEFKTQKTFTDGGISQEVDYSARYQLTKLASDTFQFYDFTERNAEICNARDTFKKLASIRGGRALEKEMASHLLKMDDFSSVTITASATGLKKTASAVADKEEPWKLVVVNGAEYFVSNKEAEQTEEPVKKVTAALNTKHVYTVRIQAHNISEIAKIADMAEDKLHAVSATTQIPTQNTIIFDVASEETPDAVTSSIQKELEGGKIYLPDTNIKTFHDSCPCGCENPGAAKPVNEVDSVETTVEQVAPKLPETGFALIIAGNPKVAFASTVETLQKYADAHYENYQILDNKGNVAFEKKASSETFGDALNALAKEADSVIEKLAADGKVTVFDQSGTEKTDGADIQQGDTVVNNETGVVTKVKEVASEQDNLNIKAADEEQSLKELDPNEKNPEETKATGDDDVKRWKGMREDPSTGKYVVYITETEEHIFDNVDSAINFLTKK